jgi:anti-sigma B factor antagonist
MPLEVQQRNIDGVTILDFDGRLVVGREATDGRRSFSDVAASEAKNLIVNLQKVAYIDSTGLGTLIVGHSIMKEAGGAMKLLHLSKRHMELMVLSKLTTVFEIFDDEQTAINSFYPDREVKHFDILEFVKSQEGEKAHLGADSVEQNEPSEA